MENPILQWSRVIIKASLRAGTNLATPDAITAFADDPRQRPSIPPERLEYLRKLIQYILDGRDITTTYNFVLLAVLAVLTVIHWSGRFRNWRCLKRREEPREDGIGADSRKKYGAEERRISHERDTSPDDAPASSSSSSTILGIQTPSEAAKISDAVDLERQPLLGSKGSHDNASGTTRPGLMKVASSWLMYQPRPLPIVHRSLPSNGTSVFVFAYIGVNMFCLLYRIPTETQYFFAFAERAGGVFVVNLPLLYLLAAKNQPIKFLTGRSYEALNIFHRRVGELMCFVAAVHFGSMLLWEAALTPEWLKIGDLQYFLTRPLVLLGIGAFVSYELLFFTSLGSFRQRWYEIFLASHVVLQIAALVFLYLHFWIARAYVLASLIIFFLDRLVWRLSIKSASMQADLHVLEDENTLMMSANWDVSRRAGSRLLRLFQQSIKYGWQPMDHVFITVPSLGRRHDLQAHPFTIASAAPTPTTSEGTAEHAWFNLLIRAHDGFTLDLLNYARLQSSVLVRIDGPYGSAHALEMLQASDDATLIAGGSGIAVVFPLAWALANGARRGCQKVHLIWVVRSRSHRSWIPQERLDELADAGVRITIPEPTAEAGRPDVGAYIDHLSAGAQHRGTDLGLVVSGPDNLNRAIRNACAGAVRKGANIRLCIEKFGW